MTPTAVKDRQTAGQDDQASVSKRGEHEDATSTLGPLPTTQTIDADPPSGGGGNNQNVRVTVNVTRRSYTALERASELTGDNRTDTINRALLAYALIHELIEQGGGKLTIVNKNGEKEIVHIL